MVASFARRFRRNFCSRFVGLVRFAVNSSCKAGRQNADRQPGRSRQEAGLGASQGVAA
jgi:hypothetical protein